MLLIHFFQDLPKNHFGEDLSLLAGLRSVCEGIGLDHFFLICNKNLLLGIYSALIEGIFQLIYKEKDMLMNG